ncbi:MAG: thioredoxin family protein [Myxococcota bacterium]
MTRPPRRLWLVAMVIIVAAAGAWFSAQRTSATTVSTIDLSDGRPKLFELGMGLCEQCKKMKPVMERAARELGNTVDVHVLDIRETANRQLAERYQLRVIPLVILADGAGKELWRHEGFVDFPEISRMITDRLERR